MYKEIQNGAVAKSYMRKGFLIYEEMRKYLVIYEEAVSHIWLWNCSIPNFFIYEENFIFFFITALAKLGRPPSHTGTLAVGLIVHYKVLPLICAIKWLNCSPLPTEIKSKHSFSNVQNHDTHQTTVHLINRPLTNDHIINLLVNSQNYRTSHLVTQYLAELRIISPSYGTPPSYGTLHLSMEHPVYHYTRHWAVKSPTEQWNTPHRASEHFTE